MKKKLLIITIFLSYFTSYAWGHSDTVFTIEKDGTINGLPKDYHPASYSKKSYTLRIGKNIVRFPTCIKNELFPFRDEHEISLTGSWYHRRSSLPPYLNFVISMPKRNYSFRILLELDTLKIIEVGMTDRFDKKDFIRTLENKFLLNEPCKKSYLDAIELADGKNKR